MSDLDPIEPHVRVGEQLDEVAGLVVRGWPLTVEGLMRNAGATSSRFSREGAPLVAVSAEVTVGAWDLDALLAGPRLRTRSRYAAASIPAVIEAGFELLATFAAPHYSLVLPTYTEPAVQRLLDALGGVLVNPHHERRQR